MSFKKNALNLHCTGDTKVARMHKRVWYTVECLKTGLEEGVRDMDD